MDIKQRLTAIISIVIAIVVCSTVLIPIVNESTKTTGDPVTYEQIGYLSGGYLVKMTEDEVHTVQYFAPEEGETEGTALLDGVPLPDIGPGYWHSVGYGAPAVVECRIQTHAVHISWGTSYYQLNDGETVTFGNGKITWDDGEEHSLDIKGDYYCYHQGTPTDDSERETHRVASERNNYISQITDVIIASSFRIDGINYKVLYENNHLIVEGCDNAELVYTTELVAGTTDIYKLTDLKIIGDTNDGEQVEIDINRYLVPSYVRGHADSGVLTTLVGILPVLVIVGLILAVTSIFLIRGRDFDE